MGLIAIDSLQIIITRTLQYIIPTSQAEDRGGLARDISLKERTQQEPAITLTLESVSRDNSQTDSSSGNDSTRFLTSMSPPTSSRSNSGHGNNIKPKTQQTPTVCARFLRSSSAKKGANSQAIDNNLPRKKRKLSNAYPVDVCDPMDYGTP